MACGLEVSDKSTKVHVARGLLDGVSLHYMVHEYSLLTASLFHTLGSVHLILRLSICPRSINSDQWRVRLPLA